MKSSSAPTGPAAGRRWRWLRRLVGGLVALAGLAAAALLLLDLPNRSPPPDTAAIEARARRYAVRIRRDEWGVPHVRGTRDRDVAFGLAFAHAEDDYRTIETSILAARGTLAARDGMAAATTDYLAQLMGVRDAVARAYPGLPAALRAVLEAYADGLNYYAVRHPGTASAGVLPVTGRDIALTFAFKTPFFYSLDRVFRDLATPPKPTPPDPRGSNGVAVAPSRSADGATRLLLNSHQPYKGVAAWYEAVLESDEGWHVAGGFFPGSPFLLYGHNADLGWATTVNKPDLADVYRLVVKPGDPDRYRLDGHWERFEKRQARIRVKLWGPFYWTATRPVVRSRHGPVMINSAGAFAVRYAGLGEGRQTLQYYRMNKARSLAEWRAALALRTLPNINYVYADRLGNIAMVYSGQYPVRRPGLDWSGVLPGDRSDLIWTRYRPFAQTPQLYNPRCGLLFNTNNDPTRATACPDDGLRRSALDPTMGVPDWMNNRAWRVLETYGADAHITAEAFRRYKYDISYSQRSRERQLVARLLAMPAERDPDLAAAQAVLGRWDGRMSVASRSAALAQLTAELALAEPNSGKQILPPRAALAEAMRRLRGRFGRVDPRWGEVNRMYRGDRSWPIDGGRDTFRAAWGKLQDDGTIRLTGGDSLILFVTWDRAGRLRSESVHQFGSATLDPHSPHFADQVPLFVAMRTKPILFTDAELRGHVARDYTPQTAR